MAKKFFPNPVARSTGGVTWRIYTQTVSWSTDSLRLWSVWPRAWPGAFGFFKKFSFLGTNLY